MKTSWMDIKKAIDFEVDDACSSAKISI